MRDTFINMYNMLPKDFTQYKQWLFYKQGTKAPYIWNKDTESFSPRYTNEQKAIENKSHVFTRKDLLTLSSAIDILEPGYGISYYLESANYAFIDIDNAFIDNTNNLRSYFDKLVKYVTKQGGAVFYSISRQGLHIPVKITKRLKYTSNELRAFDFKDIETNLKDSTGKLKIPKIEYFTSQPRHMCFSFESFNHIIDNFITEDQIYKCYELFKNKAKVKDKPIEAKKTFDNTNIDYIINNVPIENVLSDFANFNEDLNKKALCPFHDGHSVSFERFNKNSNKCVCYSSTCSAGIENSSGQRIIDVLSVVQDKKGVGLNEALKILRDKYLPGYKFDYETIEYKQKQAIEDFKEPLVLDTDKKSIVVYDNMNNYIDNRFYSDIERNIAFKAVKTGFQNVDKHLYGLYPGLYVLGAVSSLGKTTFALQMADNIARTGQDVLFISLEQTRLELLSKTLSRLAFANKNEMYNNLQIQANQDSELTHELCDYYKRHIGKHMYIVEAIFNCTLDTIESAINRHVKSTGNIPVVIVDYLQAIKPKDRFITDKANVDITIQGLKKLSSDIGTPIFVISSLNRANYMLPISFESFKESGGIEYTADIILGLQYQIVNFLDEYKDTLEKRKRFSDAKRMESKEIELVCLKNRRGVPHWKCDFSFISAYSFYQPIVRDFSTNEY